MVRTGTRNLITDVPGLRVGQAVEAGLRTGVTVVLPDSPARTVVDRVATTAGRAPLKPA